MKKLLLMLMMPLMLCSVSGCKASVLDDGVGTDVGAETKKESESETKSTDFEKKLCDHYEYALVYTQITGSRYYYHISNYREYFNENGIGLELELAVSKKYVYYFEANLRYYLSTNYESNLGNPIE